jgi:hypothetical protein
MSLSNYRVAFVDSDGIVFDAVQFMRANDDEAIDAAYRLDIPSIGAGFDIWGEGRLVHSHRRDS